VAWRLKAKGKYYEDGRIGRLVEAGAEGERKIALMAEPSRAMARRYSSAQLGLKSKNPLSEVVWREREDDWN
jgi:hypothetical protein